MKSQRKPSQYYRPHQDYLRPSNSGPPTRHYDRDSGQIYHDVEISAPRRERSDWIGELKTPNLVKAQRPNARRARTLFDMASNTIARQMRSLSPVHLAVVPWSVAEKIYDEITKNRLESFHTWRTFAKAYPDQFTKAKRRYQLEIKHPALPIPEYLKGMNSADFNWVTCLRISPRQISTTELVQLAKLRNLAVLELSDEESIDDSDSNFDERIVRTWAELAASEGAFSQLRVLLLGWQSTLSTWIFQYLDNFPSFCYLLITDCQRMHQRNRPDWEQEADKYGWVARSAKKSAKSLRPLLDDHSFYLGGISGCYYNSQELLEKLSTDEKGITYKLPVLECWIGTPRLWTHIVQEYPGTRTIWFDNVKETVKNAKKPMEVALDPGKRVRDHDMVSKGLQSPPAKKTVGRFRHTGRNAPDLLRELGVWSPPN